MKKLKISTLIVTCVFFVLTLSSCKYKYLLDPLIEVNEKFPENLTSGKSIAEYARNIVEQDYGEEFEIGSLDMTLDSELKGEGKVGLVEKGKKRPQIAYVKFDTKNNMLLNFYYYGYETKVYPGIIDFQNWKIDYEDAIEISEEFYSETEGFQYDSVLIETNDSYRGEEGWEVWRVLFYDYQNEKRYYTHIDPYTGGVLDHEVGELYPFGKG